MFRKKGRESLEVSPQARDQSNKDPLKEQSSWSLELSKSSKVRWLRSLQIHHRRHNGTKFQIFEECFPNQFHQPKSKSETVLGKTHKIPKDLKTNFHNQWAISQWSSKWSIVSPQQRHIIHRPTKSKPLSLKLSPVKILFQATLQTKKETHLGALTFQIPFQVLWSNYFAFVVKVIEVP